MKVYIKNRQKLIKVNRRRITGLLLKSLGLLGLNRAELSILFVNDAGMRRLNRQYRGIDRTTDVLSFPQYEKNTQTSRLRKSPGATNLRTQGFILGDIVVNLHKAARQAAEHGSPFNEEMKRLLIHGLLHLIGYDHEKSAYCKRKMEKISKELFSKIV
jgi:probable rRNA maturation factor